MTKFKKTSADWLLIYSHLFDIPPNLDHHIPVTSVSTVHNLTDLTFAETFASISHRRIYCTNTHTHTHTPSSHSFGFYCCMPAQINTL